MREIAVACGCFFLYFTSLEARENRTEITLLLCSTCCGQLRRTASCKACCATVPVSMIRHELLQAATWHCRWEFGRLPGCFLKSELFKLIVTSTLRTMHL